MQTIQFDIEDNKLNTFLALMENLQEGLIKNLTVTNDNKLDKETIAYMKTSQFQEDKAMLEQRLEDIKSGKTTCVPHDEMWRKIAQYKNNA